MGSSHSYTAKLQIADWEEATTSFDPLSEDGFVWVYVDQIAIITDTLNSNFPIWMKLSINTLTTLPVYNSNNLVTVAAPIDPNGQEIGIYYPPMGPAPGSEAFSGGSSVKNNVLTFTTLGVISPSVTTSLNLYTQHSTLAPQLPQISTSDLLAEIVQRESNPLDSRKLPDNVSIIINNKNNNNNHCCKKCKHYHN